jgi:hypothetical protein
LNHRESGGALLHRHRFAQLVHHGRIDMNFDTESIDGYAVPVDPMDMLQCDSCQ